MSSYKSRPIFTVTPYVNAGPIVLGNRRSAVQAAMTTAGYPLKVSIKTRINRDIFGDPQLVVVTYENGDSKDDDPVLDIAEFVYPSRIIIQHESLSLLDPLFDSYNHVTLSVRAVDPSAVNDQDGFSSKLLGLTCWDNGSESADQLPPLDDFGCRPVSSGPSRSFTCVGFLSPRQIEKYFTPKKKETVVRVIPTAPSAPEFASIVDDIEPIPNSIMNLDTSLLERYPPQWTTRIAPPLPTDSAEYVLFCSQTGTELFCVYAIVVQGNEESLDRLEELISLNQHRCIGIAMLQRRRPLSENQVDEIKSSFRKSLRSAYARLLNPADRFGMTDALPFQWSALADAQLKAYNRSKGRIQREGIRPNPYLPRRNSDEDYDPALFTVFVSLVKGQLALISIDVLVDVTTLYTVLRKLPDTYVRPFSNLT